MSEDALLLPHSDPAGSAAAWVKTTEQHWDVCKSGDRN